MIIIGLTGNIGSGKSTVARCLAELGAEVIDADIVARDVVAIGTVGLKKIIEEFGTGILDQKGDLDRAAMAAIVFDNLEARLKLEAIIHPEVIRLISGRILNYRNGLGSAPVLVVEVPLLIETGMHKMVDEVWVVIAGREAQIKRVMDRSGLSLFEVQKRIQVQIPQEEKCKYADKIIDNSGSVDKTVRQVKDLWCQLMAINLQENNLE